MFVYTEVIPEKFMSKCTQFTYEYSEDENRIFDQKDMTAPQLPSKLEY